MPSREMILATITCTRRGLVRNVLVIVLCRYSDPMVITPMARVRR